MPQTGTLAVHVFTSQAQIPIPGATISVSRRSSRGKHTLLAVRVTNENGEITPIPVAAPLASESENPGTKFPYASLDIRVKHPDYEMEIAEDVQIFPGVTSLLPVVLLPLSERADPAESSNTIHISPQTL